jgi:MSHA pilin protein MshA
MNRQSGFTLIELIVVIVILGILAATAMPKLTSMTDASNAAMIKAIEGSMRSSNAMIYGEAATQNQVAATGLVTINGTPINTQYGYAANVQQLALNMDLSPATNFDAGVANPLVLALLTAPASANCSTTYTPATISGVYVIPPAYVTVTTGC